jgi:hypothetical protein
MISDCAGITGANSKRPSGTTRRFKILSKNVIIPYLNPFAKKQPHAD